MKNKNHKDYNKCPIYKTSISFYAKHCIKCDRIIPNKEHLTKKGCIWCDTKLHRKKRKVK
jgi:hypothetical protein